LIEIKADRYWARDDHSKDLSAPNWFAKALGARSACWSRS